MIEHLAKNLTFVELNDVETIVATRMAKKLGVRGARIHDLLHSKAAEKSLAEILMTLDSAGFIGLSGSYKTVEPILKQ